VCPIIAHRLIQSTNGWVTTESVTAYRSKGLITVKARLSAPPQTLALHLAPLLRDRDVLDLGAVPLEHGSLDTLNVSARVLEAAKFHSNIFSVQGVPEEVRTQRVARAFLLAAYKLPGDPIWDITPMGTTSQLLVTLAPGVERLPEQIELKYGSQAGHTTPRKLTATRFQTARQTVAPVDGAPPPQKRILDGWRRRCIETAEARRRAVQQIWAANQRAAAAAAYQRAATEAAYQQAAAEATCQAPSQPQSSPHAPQPPRANTEHRPVAANRPTDPRLNLGATTVPHPPPAPPASSLPHRRPTSADAAAAAEQRALDLREEEDRVVREQRRADHQRRTALAAECRAAAACTAATTTGPCTGEAVQSTPDRPAQQCEVAGDPIIPAPGDAPTIGQTEQAADTAIITTTTTVTAATPAGSRRRSRSLSRSPEDAPARKHSSCSRGRDAMEPTDDELVARHRGSGGGWGQKPGEDLTAYIKRLRDRRAGMSTPREKSAESRRARAQPKDRDHAGDSRGDEATPSSPAAPSLQLRLSQSSQAPTQPDAAVEPPATQP